MSRLKATEYPICLPGVSLTVALLADLHDGNPDEAIAILRAAPPDLILIAGDLYESPPRNGFSFGNAIRLLDGISGLAPILYCRGNHDQSSHPSVDRALAAAGVVELDSSETTVCGLRVGGLRSALYAGGIPDLAFLDRFEAGAGPKLLLCHHPEYYPRYLRDRNIDLILAGHAHGGQWAIGGRGLFAPGQGLFPRYTHGVCDSRLVVSRGMHNSICLPRIGTPTEIVFLRLSGQA